MDKISRSQIQELQDKVEEYESVTNKHVTVMMVLAAYMALIGMFGVYLVNAPIAVLIILMALHKTIPFALIIYYMPIFMYRTSKSEKLISEWTDATIEYGKQAINKAKDA